MCSLFCRGTWQPSSTRPASWWASSSTAACRYSSSSSSRPCTRSLKASPAGLSLSCRICSWASCSSSSPSTAQVSGRTPRAFMCSSFFPTFFFLSVVLRMRFYLHRNVRCEMFQLLLFFFSPHRVPQQRQLSHVKHSVKSVSHIPENTSIPAMTDS